MPSIGRCDRTAGLGLAWFHLSGMYLPFSPTVRYRLKSGTLWEEVERNEGGSLEAAGLISGGAQASQSAVIRHL